MSEYFHCLYQAKAAAVTAISNMVAIVFAVVIVDNDVVVGVLGDSLFTSNY